MAALPFLSLYLFVSAPPLLSLASQAVRPRRMCEDDSVVTGSQPPCLLPARVCGIGIGLGRCAGTGWGGHGEEPPLSGCSLQPPRQANMSAELELLWPLSVPLLLLLGATAWLCVHCSRPGVKRKEKIYEQRNRQEDEESFTVTQTYSLARPVWPGSLMDTASDKSLERKNKLLFSHGEGSRHGPDAAYVDPIPTDYYNWGCSQKLPEDDDSNSYENVLICKPTAPDSGGEESEDYQNSVSIREWRESRRTVGLSPMGRGHQEGAQASPSGSPDEEPDYVNGDVAARG
ncbi:linker for activation of T-cells family member 2 isoform X2 [Mesocricetus auratus]|uniref:Linker for activation of T-cells family member 2 isoform X2 n=1 Tax=Mesocricetus auratus TaxID=10036 RepID=A0ABM2W8D4_MESAU|nr:linker for activation of T-cells family member 2 isoform X2 [Mesocricetus auratus]